MELAKRWPEGHLGRKALEILVGVIEGQFSAEVQAAMKLAPSAFRLVWEDRSVWPLPPQIEAHLVGLTLAVYDERSGEELAWASVLLSHNDGVRQTHLVLALEEFERLGFHVGFRPGLLPRILPEGAEG